MGTGTPWTSLTCTIDHIILLDRLNVYYGISELALGCFTSYLSGRTHSVKVGSTLSHPAALQYGVPQGSVLGPILFSLYTNPISLIIHSHSCINYHFYADDTQLHITLSPANLSRSMQKLKNDIQKRFQEDTTKEISEIFIFADINGSLTEVSYSGSESSTSS